MFIQYQHFDLLDKVVLERAVFKPPLNSDASLHDEACFMHVINGKSKLYSPQQQIALKNKDSLLMKCGTYVNKWFKNEDDQPNEAIFIHFYVDVLKYVYEDQVPDMLSQKKPKKPVVVEKVQINEMIGNYVDSILFYFENPSLVTDELIKLKIKELILLLVNTENGGRIRTLLSDLFHPTQYKFKEVVKAHILEDLSVPELATLAGYSLSSFKRKFKTVFGTSPTQYIKAQRLEKAKDLLESTDLRISDIAYDSGFNDLGYFSKAFSAAYHYSPSEYRKKLS